MSDRSTQSDLPQPTALLRSPTNKETKRVFIAATRQDDGKTTTCLGLYGALQTLFTDVGFIKPVGQRFVEIEGHSIDEDSLLLDTIYDVQVPLEEMSPVAIDPTFTRRYLSDPDAMHDKLIHRICHAFDRVSWEKAVTIIEGTGHAGVGAVFDLSNAQIASLLDAKVVIVSQGGIGRPVDEIALNKALFDKHGVEVIGAILNKVHPDKIPLVTTYAGKGLARLGIPLLGVLPAQKMLSTPNLSQIVEELDARWINGKAQGLYERIQQFVIGAMTARGIVDYLQPGGLVITPGDRDDVILAAIASTGISGKQVISGIILTRDIMPHQKIMELLAQTNIPVIATTHDSYQVATIINRMTIKTQPEDEDKIPVIKNMIQEHVAIDDLVSRL
ncbi:MAG TPA: AAA family ATPase [Opitutales bacterium]|nr:AAA family ATPase [Opitutales bacterium]